MVGSSASITHRIPLKLLLRRPDLQLLVLAPLVLEPNPHDPWRQPRHLHELLLHQRVRPRVGRVARLEYVQLLLTQHCPRAGALPVSVVLGVLGAAATRPAAVYEAAGHAGAEAAAAAEHVVLAVGHAHVLVGEIARS